MTPSPATEPYKHPRFPGEIISHAVWLYVRFSRSHRDVEELLFGRGIIVSYEAMRTCGRKCGQQYANPLRRRGPRPGDTWHLDAGCITITKVRHDLWRAVDQDGVVLDILVQRRRKKQAATKFFRKLLTGCQDVSRGSLRINSRAMGPPSARSSLVLNIASIGISITARRTRITPPGRASDSCKDVSRRSTRAGFLPRMDLWPSTADRGVLVCPRPSPVKQCGRDVTGGGR